MHATKLSSFSPIITTDDRETGAVVFWRLDGGPVALAKLSAAWTAAGLDPAELPQPPSEAVALRRALAESESRQRRSERLPDGRWALVESRPRGTADLDHVIIARVGLSETQAVTIDAETEALRSKLTQAVTIDAETEALRSKLTADYLLCSGRVDAHDASEWLARLCRRHDAVALRAGGGVYFVPKHSLAAFRARTKVIREATGYAIRELPAMEGAAAVEAIREALLREVTVELEAISADISSGKFGKRGLATRASKAAELRGLVQRYADAVGTLADAEAAIADMEAAIAVAALAVDAEAGE